METKTRLLSMSRKRFTQVRLVIALLLGVTLGYIVITSPSISSINWKKSSNSLGNYSLKYPPYLVECRDEGDRINTHLYRGEECPVGDQKPFLTLLVNPEGDYRVSPYPECYELEGGENKLRSGWRGDPKYHISKDANIQRVEIFTVRVKSEEGKCASPSNQAKNQAIYIFTDKNQNKYVGIWDRDNYQAQDILYGLQLK